MSGRIEGDRVRVEAAMGYRGAHGIAVAPDGSVAELHVAARSTEGVETAFRRARHIDVEVLSDEGKAVKGVRVGAFHNGGDAWAPIAATDVEGHARIDGLLRLPVILRAGLDGWGYGGFSVDRDVDLAAGDPRVQVEVGAERDLEVAVFVNGEARLPSGLRIGVPSGAWISSREEDPEHGVVRMRTRPFLPKEEGSVSVSGRGLSDFGASFAWPAPGATVRLRADLTSHGTIVVHVKAAASLPIELMLEAPSEEGEGWSDGGPIEDSEIRGDRDLRIEDVRPGTYRVRDRTTGLHTAPFTVRDGGGDVHVSIDLSGVFEVAGRVEMPPDYGWDARVVSDDERIDKRGLDSQFGPGPAGWPVHFDEDEQFRFQAWLPGGGPTTLRVVHPELVAAAQGGSVVLSGPPAGEVVLRLVEGPRAVFRLKPPPGATEEEAKSDGWDGPQYGRVVLYPDGSGEPLGWHRLALVEGVRRLAGFAPGTYTLWLDVSPFAPRLLRGVALGPGRTDLGEVAFDGGATIAIRVLVHDGAKAPQIRGAAEPQKQPSYQRDVERSGDDVRIRGLGPGTFDVGLSWTGPDGLDRHLSRTVEIGEGGAPILEVDAR